MHVNEVIDGETGEQVLFFFSVTERLDRWLSRKTVMSITEDDVMLHTTAFQVR